MFMYESDIIRDIAPVLEIQYVIMTHFLYTQS